MNSIIKSILKKKSSNKTKKKVTIISPDKSVLQKSTIKPLVTFKKKEQLRTPKSPVTTSKTRHSISTNSKSKEKLSKKIEELSTNNNSVSYSPSENKNIKKLSISRSKLSLHEDDDFNIESINKNMIIPKINIYDKNHTKTVKLLNSSVVKRKMLKNLSSKKKFNCNNIIMPKQILSNCWFNTFFVSFFISDKGAKFFKHLRKQMIKGQKTDGTLITPKRLRRSLLLLNYYIELSTSDYLKSKLLAKNLNTNALIYNIYKGIPDNLNQEDKHYVDEVVRNINEPGNPMNYYIGLMTLLSTNGINFTQIIIDTYLQVNKLKLIETLELTEHHNFEGIPNFIVIIINDNMSGLTNFKKMNYNLTISGKKYKYKLDSIIIRDKTRAHWGSVFTCNKNLYGFDGDSNSRINFFNWEKYLNKIKDWTFVGSTWKNDDGDTGDHVWWNFMDGVQYLFYFRD